MLRTALLVPLVALVAFGSARTIEAASTANAAPCALAPRSGLADLGNALTSDTDAVLRRAADADRARLEACGRERDAIALELIAADAYGDVRQPEQRCSTLLDAARRSQRLGDLARTRDIERAAATCAS